MLLLSLEPGPSSLSSSSISSSSSCGLLLVAADCIAGCTGTAVPYLWHDDLPDLLVSSISRRWCTDVARTDVGCLALQTHCCVDVAGPGQRQVPKGSATLQSQKFKYTRCPDAHHICRTCCFFVSKAASLESRSPSSRGARTSCRVSDPNSTTTRTT